MQVAKSRIRFTLFNRRERRSHGCCGEPPLQLRAPGVGFLGNLGVVELRRTAVKHRRQTVVALPKQPCMNEARRAVLLLQAQAQLPARKGSGASQAEAGKPRASHPQKPETCAGPKRREARMSSRLSVSEAQSWKCVACAAAGRKACCPGTDDADGGGCQRGPPVLVCSVPVRRFMARGGGQGGLEVSSLQSLREESCTRRAISSRHAVSRVWEPLSP